MSDEIKEEKKCCCCISDGYKKFLLTILASFLGCLVALCLYNASVKPPMPQPCPCPLKRMEAPKFEHHRGDRAGFEHKKMHGQFEHKKFEHQKPPVKPEK